MLRIIKFHIILLLVVVKVFSQDDIINTSEVELVPAAQPQLDPLNPPSPVEPAQPTNQNDSGKYAPHAIIIYVITILTFIIN